MLFHGTYDTAVIILFLIIGRSLLPKADVNHRAAPFLYGLNCLIMEGLVMPAGRILASSHIIILVVDMIILLGEADRVLVDQGMDPRLISQHDVRDLRETADVVRMTMCCDNEVQMLHTQRLDHIDGRILSVPSGSLAGKRRRST